MNDCPRGGRPALPLPDATITFQHHADVAGVAQDAKRFSSAVSRFLQVPNGLDGEEHRQFRSLIDRYFTPDAMEAFAPVCRTVAHGIVGTLPHVSTVEVVREIGMPFAVRAQSAWLGWPNALEPELLAWLADKQQALRSADPVQNAEVADRFDGIIRRLIDARRDSDGAQDVTDRLIHDGSVGRPLEEAEVVSILRNWTGGDLVSMSLAVGVVVHGLATQPGICEELRHAESDDGIDSCLEEMLRLNDPFPSSRRVATQATTVGGVHIAAGQRIALDWRAANQDPQVFAPDHPFDPERHAAANLVFGTGPHACPGRPLVRLELRELTRALLTYASRIELAGPPVPESAPLGGFREVPVRLTNQA